ncbi:MAG: hypothetical protein IT366_24605 [Candidatus Hydrogenedentes bacterium]|nr:hypothetical protein [Candidatus Hydrogenedentota bacterium]
MAIEKNVAGQKLFILAVDSAGIEKTGDAANITARISLDGGTPTQTNDVNPTEIDATYQKGLYYFDLTQAETNARVLTLSADSSTAGVVIRPVIVYTVAPTSLSVPIAGGSSTLNALTVHHLHSMVTDALPEGAPMRGFLAALWTVLEAIRMKGCWSFWQARSQIVLLNAYSTGTVAVTQDSSAVVGTGTAFTAAMVGRKFRGAGNEVYTITARADATHITISPEYQGASASGLAYTIFQDTYDLPSDVESVAGWWDATNQKWLRPVTMGAIGDCQNASNFTSAWPQKIAQYGTNAGVPQVVVWPAPQSRALIPLMYTRRHVMPIGPANTIDVPAKMDTVLLQGMIYFMKSRLPKAFKDELGSGDLEHERNRFYKMLDQKWSEDQAILRGTEYDIAPQAGLPFASGDEWIAGPAVPA